MSNFKKITLNEAKEKYDCLWAINVKSKNNRLGLEPGLYIEENYLYTPIHTERGIQAKLITKRSKI